MLLTTESIVICAPLTLLLLVRELPFQLQRVLHAPEPEALAILASGLFMLAALGCLWRLVVAFAVQGSAALHRVSAHVFVLAALAVALGVRMAFHLAPANVAERSWLNAFAWGLPFAVPLSHLCLERWFRGAPRSVAPQRRASRI